MLLNCGIGEDSWESPFDFKEIQPTKGNQSCILIGRTDAEAETSMLWPSDAKNWLIWKDPDAGNDWRWEEKGKTEDEMVEWHYWLDGHGFGWTPGVGDGQGGLAGYSSWGRKKSDMTERLNWLMFKRRIVGSYAALLLLFLRDLNTVLHSGCTSLHARQECKRVPFSP